MALPAKQRHIRPKRVRQRTAAHERRIARWNAYIGFATAKTVGVTALAVSVLQMVYPKLLSAAQLPGPGKLFGIAMVLLMGERASY